MKLSHLDQVSKLFYQIAFKNEKLFESQIKFNCLLAYFGFVKAFCVDPVLHFIITKCANRYKVISVNEWKRGKTKPNSATIWNVCVECTLCIHSHSHFCNPFTQSITFYMLYNIVYIITKSVRPKWRVRTQWMRKWIKNYPKIIKKFYNFAVWWKTFYRSG